MSGNLQGKMSEIFYNSQFKKTSHQSNLKKLMDLYEKTDLEVFWDVFKSHFIVPLTFAQKHPRVQNTLQFVADFALRLNARSCANEETQEEEPLCPFLVQIFDFLLTIHCARDSAVRFRTCHFLNILFNAMGDQAFIDDDICDKITVAMMDRLLDKSPKVRAQAIFALHRLQDPSDDECQVIKMYIFHVSKDPNPEVRMATLMCMGKNQRTLQAALRRTRDVHEGVRKLAYEFVSKVTVRSLTITQRDQLLNDGLKDRSENVRKCVENTLLPSWLRHYNGCITSLVRALDAEIATDISMMALKTLFKQSSVVTLIEQLPITMEMKLIPLDKLTSENVVYWRCLVEYFQQEHSVDQVEMIIPELSKFCTYIEDYLASISLNENEIWRNNMQKFILLQLFEITTMYDLSDEAGRKKLKDLICNTLMGNYWSEQIIECVVKYLQKVIPDVNTRLDTLANIISDIRLPLKEPTQSVQISEDEQNTNNLKRAKLRVNLLNLKEEEYQAIQNKEYLRADELKNQINALNEEIVKLSEPQVVIVTEEIKEKDDTETMVKCLAILCTMLQSVSSLTPTLRSMMQIALDGLEHPDDTVHISAIRALSIYCVLDKTLAKKYLMVLFLQFSLEQENLEIWLIALKGIFDLCLLHGLEYLDIIENVDGTANKTEKSHSVKLYSHSDREVSLTSMQQSSKEKDDDYNFIKIIITFMDHTDENLRTIATEGICKLLLNRRIRSATLLSRLIILAYNPVNDNDFYLRQCLSCFFDNFLSRVPDGQQMLEEAYLPTLQIISNAPDTSSLQEVDPYDVSRFILNLTGLKIRREGTENYYCSHNSLVFIILAEILNPVSSIHQDVLLKSLKDLHLEIEDDAMKENLKSAIDKVAEVVKGKSRLLLRQLYTFDSNQSDSLSATVE
ncbi:chromosome associated protein G [Lasioglossum baleicum]|uniref:chromosome associated protein G n=1 Tax=Lasioglossum baleicum TaxID=434251 RepID=UPI003FCCED6A